jgi:hypothetical protein
MAFTAAQQTQIKNYVNTDPDALGFAPYVSAGADTNVADLLNFVRDGVTACPDNGVVGAAVTVQRNDVRPAEIVNCVATADFSAATQIQISKLEMLFVGGLVDCTLANVSGNLQSIFSSASAATKNALAAVVSRHGSALEKLLGADGVSIDPAAVGHILRG